MNQTREEIVRNLHVFALYIAAKKALPYLDQAPLEGALDVAQTLRNAIEMLEALDKAQEEGPTS